MSNIQPDLFECVRCHGITKEGVVICDACVRRLKEEVAKEWKVI